MRRPILSYSFMLIVLLFILSNKSASAQEADNVKINSPRGVQFYFINGYAVTYKFASLNNMSYRLQLDFGTSYSDQNGNNKSYYRENINSESESEQSEKNFNITFSPQLLYSIFKSEEINLYTGFGPVLGYSYRKSSQSQKNRDQNYSSDNSYESKDNIFSAGLRGFIGIESFITKSISVFAETQITGVKTWNTWESIQYSEGVQYNKTTSDRNGWLVSITNIRVGASFYF